MQCNEMKMLLLSLLVIVIVIVIVMVRYGYGFISRYLFLCSFTFSRVAWRGRRVVWWVGRGGFLPLLKFLGEKLEKKGVRDRDSL